MTQDEEPTVGRWKKVPVTDCFRDERAFTRWLASSEHIGRLGDTIDAKLEEARTEVRAGNFIVDIVCRDLQHEGQHVVIVENQFGRSDHDHFGKVMTYAGALQARTCVWIAEEFRKEHLAGFEKICSESGGDTRLIAVEVAVYEKGSERDVRFKIVDEHVVKSRQRSTRRRSGTAGASPSKAERLRMEIWNLYGDCVERKKASFTETEFRRPIESSRQRQQKYSCFGPSPVFLAVDFSSSKRVVCAYLALKTPAPEFSKHDFDILNKQESAVAMELRALGVTEKPCWNRKDGRKHATVSLEKSIDLSAGENNREEACLWMIDRLQALERVFRDRVAKLERR